MGGAVASHPPSSLSDVEEKNAQQWSAMDEGRAEAGNKGSQVHLILKESQWGVLGKAPVSPQVEEFGKGREHCNPF